MWSPELRVWLRQAIGALSPGRDNERGSSERRAQYSQADDDTAFLTGDDLKSFIVTVIMSPMRDMT
jgi:hypothetical protein